MEETSYLGKRHTFVLLPLIYIFLLVGCGGGSSRFEGRENQPPVFKAGLVETDSFDIYAHDGEQSPSTYNLRADDPEEDQLTYEISGGEDAEFFELIEDFSLSQLQFKERADYEAFADANADNIYELEIQVSDGEFTDSVHLSIHLQDGLEARIVTSGPVDWGSGFWDKGDDFERNDNDRWVNYAYRSPGYYYVDGVCEADCSGHFVFWDSDVYGGVPSEDEISIVSPLSSFLFEANDAQLALDSIGIEATPKDAYFLDPWEGALQGDSLAIEFLRFNQQLSFVLRVGNIIGESSYPNLSDKVSVSDVEMTSLPAVSTFPRAQNIYKSLANLADGSGSVSGIEGSARLDSIGTISHLFETIDLREELSEFERDYVAVAFAGVVKVSIRAGLDPTDSYGTILDNREFTSAVWDLSRGTIDLPTFATRITPSALFGAEFPGLDLPDAIPPKLISLSRVNNFPDASYLSYSVTDDDSGITEVGGVLSNQACELRFSRTYSSSLSVPLQVSDSISIAIGSSTKSGNLSLDSLDLTDADGNTFDGLKLYGSSVSFAIDNPGGDTEPAELISYSLSVDPLNSTIVVVESVIAEAAGISTGSLDGVNDTVDIEVQLEDVFNSRTVSARVLAADLIENGDGTYTATAYIELDSAQAANDAELANFRMCDAGLNLTELDKGALEAL